MLHGDSSEMGREVEVYFLLERAQFFCPLCLQFGSQGSSICDINGTRLVNKCIIKTPS